MTDTDGGSIGGGEILKYWGSSTTKQTQLMNVDSIIQQAMLPYICILVAILLLIVATLLILKILDVKSPTKGKGMKNALAYMDAIRKHDASVIANNRRIRIVTQIVEKTPFALPRRQVEYWQYNIDRAQIYIPGHARLYKATELHAVFIAIATLLDIVCIPIAMISPVLGVSLMIFFTAMMSVFPMRVIRATVQAKDDEIIENFADFYLMLHYVLMASSSTPMAGIMKQYQKTTDSEEMKHFVDVCIHYIDTYGEYEATRYISKAYREIPQVAKLMRLIRQANEGGDIKAELIGFRTELLNARKYEIEKRMNKLIQMGRAQFNILMPILIQAIISAMSIYFEDLGGVTTWLG